MSKTKAIAIVAICVAVIVASLSAVFVWQKRDSVARAQLRIAESREEAAKNAARQALSEEKAAAANEAAKAAEAKAASDKLDALELESEIQAAAAQKASADAEAARENRIARERDADAAAMLRASEKSKADRAKAEADRAKAEADSETAKAEAARAKADQEAAVTQRISDELKLWEIRQNDLVALERELNDYKRELDERELALRPEKTIKDLVNIGTEGNEKSADDPAALLPENNHELPRNTRILSRAERLVDEGVAQRSERSRAFTLDKLETLYIAAVREERIPDAEFYRATIKSMYPDWIYKPKKPANEANEEAEGDKQ